MFNFVIKIDVKASFLLFRKDIHKEYAKQRKSGFFGYDIEGGGKWRNFAKSRGGDLIWSKNAIYRYFGVGCP